MNKPMKTTLIDETGYSEAAEIYACDEGYAFQKLTPLMHALRFATLAEAEAAMAFWVERRKAEHDGLRELLHVNKSF